MIMDNHSTSNDTINFLKQIDIHVIYRKTNSYPLISQNYNTDLYNILPDKFILTDPDLEFNQALPYNFVEILCNLSDKYCCNKIGFALDISDFDIMFQGEYYTDYTIYDWEKQFWKNKIINSKYELYKADIDTTFVLINKKYLNDYNIRIAGEFVAKHLPWYIDNKINNIYESYLLYLQQTKISTIKNTILKYIETNYVKVYKNNEMFFIQNKDNTNIDFWTNKYLSWKQEFFDIFDKYMDINKIFIDIGAWIGTNSLYASRKSKHVYCIESDKQSFEDLTTNMKANCFNNYTLINKTICNIDKFMQDFNININEISFIKVDIKGEEENILLDLYNIHKKHNIPLYLNFYYNSWKDKNLDRFDFLSDNQKKQIQTQTHINITFLK
jgi:hypothetical protein